MSCLLFFVVVERSFGSIFPRTSIATRHLPLNLTARYQQHQAFVTGHETRKTSAAGLLGTTHIYGLQCAEHAKVSKLRAFGRALFHVHHQGCISILSQAHKAMQKVPRVSTIGVKAIPKHERVQGDETGDDGNDFETEDLKYKINEVV